MPDVTIYTRKFCGYCIAAKNVFMRQEVAFTEHDATHDMDLRSQMITRANGASTFPQIFVDGVHIGGCDDLMAFEREGRLAKLLQR